MLKRFLKDESGGAPLWAVFCVIIFFMLASLLYNVHTIYSKYYAVQDEMTRCAAITLNANMANSKLRDISTNVEYQAALDVLEANLIEKGWTPESGGWAKFSGGKLNCRLTGMAINNCAKSHFTWRAPQA